jgi:hypothetical protein
MGANFQCLSLKLRKGGHVAASASFLETKKAAICSMSLWFRKMEDQKLKNGEKMEPDIRGTECLFWSRADGADKAIPHDTVTLWRKQKSGRDDVEERM